VRRAAGDEARDDQAQAAIRDHPVREAADGHEAAVGERPAPAGEIRRRVLRIGLSGEQEDWNPRRPRSRRRVSAAGHRVTGLAEELARAALAWARKLPRLALDTCGARS
jgi:hypothetical protein